MADGDERSCSVCIFPFTDAEDGHAAPNLERLREQIRAELRQQQRDFAAYVEQRLSEALNADKFTTKVRQINPSTSWWPPQEDSNRSTPRFSLDSNRSTPRFSQESPREEYQLIQKGGYSYMGIRRSQTAPREPTELQVQWMEEWLAEVEDGDLGIYTCLGLSNCFSRTSATLKFTVKAVGATLLQMLVPFCLLLAELQQGVQFGPARDNLNLRLVGFTLYGYAIYSMHNGADGHCRTGLLNLMFQYDNVPMGNWLPLLIGEIADLFTAIVLTFVLYAIFTTQTAPEDLIMNAIAINFLCDVDSSFVDKDMKKESVEKFKVFVHNLFTTQQARHDDPYSLTVPARFSKGALYVIALAGVVGCSCFVINPSHSDGEGAVKPRLSRHLTTLKYFNGTLSSVGD